MPIEHGSVMNVAASHSKADGKWEDPKWVKHVTRAEMLEDYEGWNQQVTKMLALMDDPDVWALFEAPPASTYYRKGKICLLGDAAHASTPHHGAGAGMAVEDAFILSRLLASVDDVKDLVNAFAAYDQVRRPRTQRLVTSSNHTAKVYDLEDEKFGESIEGVLGYLSHAWDWIWGEDLKHELWEAQTIFEERKKSAVVSGSAL